MRHNSSNKVAYVGLIRNILLFSCDKGSKMQPFVKNTLSEYEDQHCHAQGHDTIVFFFPFPGLPKLEKGIHWDSQDISITHLDGKFEVEYRSSPPPQ
eukprot:2961398-Amphidinium_carterae.1